MHPARDPRLDEHACPTPTRPPPPAPPPATWSGPHPCPHPNPRMPTRRCTARQAEVEGVDRKGGEEDTVRRRGGHRAPNPRPSFAPPRPAVLRREEEGEWWRTRRRRRRRKRRRTRVAAAARRAGHRRGRRPALGQPDGGARKKRAPTHFHPSAPRFYT